MSVTIGVEGIDPLHAQEAGQGKDDPFHSGQKVTPSLALRQLDEHLQGVHYEVHRDDDGTFRGLIFYSGREEYGNRKAKRRVELKDLQKTLPHLPELRVLVFEQGTGVTDEWLPVIAKCKELSSLAIMNGEVTSKGLEVLAKLSLSVACFDGCSKLDDEAMTTVADWEKLQKLYLAKAAISDDGIHTIRGLVDLQVLQVTGGTRPLTNISVPVLKTFKNLTHLDISDSQIDEAGLRELQATLPACLIVQ